MYVRMSLKGHATLEFVLGGKLVRKEAEFPRWQECMDMKNLMYSVCQAAECVAALSV